MVPRGASPRRIGFQVPHDLIVTQGSSYNWQGNPKPSGVGCSQDPNTEPNAYMISFELLKHCRCLLTGVVCDAFALSLEGLYFSDSH